MLKRSRRADEQTSRRADEQTSRRADEQTSEKLMEREWRWLEIFPVLVLVVIPRESSIETCHERKKL
jgi:hypothetical protein